MDLIKLSVASPVLYAFSGLTGAPNKGVYLTSPTAGETYDLTAFGRSVGGAADAAAARTLLGLGSLATAGSVNDASWSGTDLSVANGGTGASTAPAARGNLGLAIGSDVQAYHANLAALSGLTGAAGKITYWTGAGALALADFTPGAWDTWVPVVAASTPAGSGWVYTPVTAKYSKVGRTVTATFLGTLNNLGTGPAGSGQLTVELPFTAANASVSVGLEAGVTSRAMTVAVSGGSKLATLRMFDAATTVVANYQHRFTIVYEATS